MNRNMTKRICTCGKEFFPTLGVTKCEECLKKDMELQQQVREYVEKHPGVTVVDVSKLFSISPTRVRQMIRNDVIQFSDNSAIKIACEKCGAPIIGGRFCDKCSQLMMASGAYQNNKELPKTPKLVVDERYTKKNKGKMRFI